MKPLIHKAERYRRSLRFRLIIGSVLVEVVMLALLLGNTLRLSETHLTRMAGDRLREVEETFSIALSVPLAARDHASLRSLADRLVGLPDVSYLVITAPDGLRLVEAGEPPAVLPPPDAAVTADKPAHHAVLTIDLFGQPVGRMHYGLSTAFLVRAKQELFTQSMGIALAEVLLSVIALSTITVLLTQRLDALTSASVRIAAGDYHSVADVRGNDEVAALSAAFNTMASAVRDHVSELQKTAANLKASNADLARLAEVTAHHLQEPLRHMVSYSQLLNHRYRGRLDAEADEFLRYLVDAARQMKAMLIDLQEYIALDTSDLPSGASANLAACFAEARRSLSSLIRDSGAEIAAAELPVVHGDAQQLTQVFAQLLHNALTHRQPDTPPKVTVVVEPTDGGRVSIRICDNGPGIDSSHYAAVFDLFRRLDGHSHGSGVGLPMVKKIVLRHGGTVWMAAAGEHGLCVGFTLTAV